MSRFMRVFITGFSFTLFCAAALAADEKSNQGNYSLFNPVPKDALRPLQSEEFDKVMNPFTLDAGHYQLETDLVEWYSTSRNVNPPTVKYSSQLYTWYPTVKVGLLNNLDFEVAPSYSMQSTKLSFPFGTIKNNSDNFGRVMAAAKVNLWGNDEGLTAFALKPYLTIPTHGGDVLGGMEAALAFRLPWKMTLKVSSGLEAVENNRAIYGQFANRLTLEKMFGEKTTVFVNLNGLVTSQSSRDWWGYTGAGVGYNITKNFQVYAAMRFGLESGFDYDPYVGITWRY